MTTRVGAHPVGPFLNLLIAVLAKFTSIAYNILVLGLIARKLPAASSLPIFALFTQLAIVTVFQAGLATSVVREASGTLRPSSRSQRGRLSVLFWAGVCSSLVTVAISLGSRAPPLILFAEIAGAAAFADQFRAGTGGSWISNGLLVLSYALVGLSCLLPVPWSHLRGEWVAYSPPYIASALSFVVLVIFSRELVRGLLLVEWSDMIVLAESVPFLVVSALSAALLYVPTAGALFPWMPQISGGDLIVYRLLMSVSAVYYFLIQSTLPPTLAQMRDGRTDARSSFLMLTSGFAVLALLIGMGLCVLGERMAVIWTGGQHLTFSPPFEWFLAGVGWTGMTLGLQIEQYWGEPWVAAAILALAPLLAFFAQAGGLNPVAAISLGTFTAMICAFILVARSYRRFNPGDI